MTALAGKRADIYVTGTPTNYPANDPMSDITANVPANPALLPRTVYAVTAGARRYFDPATPAVFQISLNSGGSWSPVTPDNQDAGLISFLASQQAAPAAQFRVSSGKYLPFSRLGGGHTWEENGAFDLIDVTEFGATSKVYMPALGGGTIALKRFWYDDSMRSLLGALLVVTLWIDDSAQPAGPRYECLAMIKSDSIKSAVKSAIEEDITLEIQGDISYLST